MYKLNPEKMSRVKVRADNIINLTFFSDLIIRNKSSGRYNHPGSLVLPVFIWNGRNPEKMSNAEEKRQAGMLYLSIFLVNSNIPSMPVKYEKSIINFIPQALPKGRTSI